MFLDLLVARVFAAGMGPPGLPGRLERRQTAKVPSPPARDMMLEGRSRPAQPAQPAQAVPVMAQPVAGVVQGNVVGVAAPLAPAHTVQVVVSPAYQVPGAGAGVALPAAVNPNVGPPTPRHSSQVAALAIFAAGFVCALIAMSIEWNFTGRGNEGSGGKASSIGFATAALVSYCVFPGLVVRAGRRYRRIRRSTGNPFWRTWGIVGYVALVINCAVMFAVFISINGIIVVWGMMTTAAALAVGLVLLNDVNSSRVNQA